MNSFILYRNRVIQCLLTMGYSLDYLENKLDQPDMKTAIGYHLLIGLTCLQSALLFDCREECREEKELPDGQSFPFATGKGMNIHAGSPC